MLVTHYNFYTMVKFAITGAGPKMSYEIMQGKMQKELPIYIRSQAAGGVEIVLTGWIQARNEKNRADCIETQTG